MASMPVLRIAFRYLRARHSHNAVNVITFVSMAGIAVAVAAMVVVLSIFNGFGDLAAANMAVLDAPLRVSPRSGGAIADADSLCRVIAARVPGVTAVPVVTERALLISGEHQVPVVFKGIPHGYDTLSTIGESIIDGALAWNVPDALDEDFAAATISVGVANSLMAAPDADHPVRLYVPRRVGRINPANPMTAFRGATLSVSGVFRTQQNDIDRDHILVPLSVARDLMEYEAQATAVEVFTDTDVDTDALRDVVADVVGPQYDVQTRLQQRATAFRMIAIEKWITFLMLAFILVIALFNIVSTLSLVVLEKRRNMETLRCLGATHAMTRRVFITLGWLITAVGAAIGMVLGVTLTLAQQYGHFLSLGAGEQAQDIMSITWYPVRLDPVDLLVVAAMAALTGLIAAQSTRLFVRRRPPTAVVSE